MYSRTDAALLKANDYFGDSMDSFIKEFAPVPPPKPDDKWLDFFLDIATMGAAAGFGSMIKAGKALSLPPPFAPLSFFSLFRVTSNANYVSTGIKQFATAATAADHDAVKDAASSLLGGAVDKIKQMHDDKTTM